MEQLAFLLREWLSPLGVVTTFATGVVDGVGITEGANGNLYVASPTYNVVYEINSAGGVSAFATGLPAPFDIITMPNGDFYVSSYVASSIIKLTASGADSPFVPALPGASYLEMDAA